MKKFKELKKNMSVAALEAAEEAYLELEEELDYLDATLSSDEDEQAFERYSECSCSSCGARLTLDEVDLYEDTCYACITEDTCGIINDNPGKEL